MIKVLLATSLIASSFAALSNPLTVEEQRISKAQTAMPTVLNAFNKEVTTFEQQFKALNNFKEAKQLIQTYSFELWDSAKQRIVKTFSVFVILITAHEILMPDSSYIGLIALAR